MDILKVQFMEKIKLYIKNNRKILMGIGALLIPGGGIAVGIILIHNEIKKRKKKDASPN